jgi:hypothetical protein
MTNNGPRGYRIGPQARVVIHRNGARRNYAVAVVVDEGPYASAADALAALEGLREAHSGWVSKAVAAQRLGISRRQVNYLQSVGVLDTMNDETGHLLVSVDSLNEELARRVSE